VVTIWRHVFAAQHKRPKKLVARRSRRGEEGLRNHATAGFLEVCGFVGMVSGVAKKNPLLVWAVEMFWRGSVGDCSQLLNSGYLEDSFRH
jgi:hypothetical protein